MQLVQRSWLIQNLKDKRDRRKELKRTRTGTSIPTHFLKVHAQSAPKIVHGRKAFMTILRK